jgi:hypothetical protein
MEINVKALIGVNKSVKELLHLTEELLAQDIKTEKDKANFGNICIMHKGLSMVDESTEAMLINENVFIDDDGNFYQKVDSVDKDSDDSKDTKDNNK